ncbi:MULTISPECIES: hypothetical protein [Streptomyces]|uniref:Uncharacterized protein n=1 Tax=Streptomyces chartreusis NRRL 3882 TaxID=1079985 RepID=A0A2N9BCE8_STRCX|nr:MULTISPECIES: hypothetical protein [Streptomyces]SOR81025.1 hypothetical protein SCNRRL3882_4478 [Streptomyces chartreusis NRRL 3882]
MSNWNPGGQPPPYGPHGGQPYPPPPPGPHPPAPGPYGPPQPPPGGGHPPHVPHPYAPHPMPPQAPPPGPFTRLRRRIGPIHTARRVFKPSRPDLVEDPFIARMQKIRTLVGLGAVVWVSVSYKIARSVEDVADDRFQQSWISVLVLSVTLPVVVGVLTALTAPSARRDLLRRAAKSFGAILALVAAVFVFPATMLTGFLDGKFATNPVMSVVTWVVIVFILVWVTPFIFWGIGLALLHVFRTADIHQTMPPLLAMTLVWEMALIDVLTGAYAGVPGPVRAVFMLGAPLSVTAVGLWELRRLRVHYGITVRGVLVR